MDWGGLVILNKFFIELFHAMHTHRAASLIEMGIKYINLSMQLHEHISTITYGSKSFSIEFGSLQKIIGFKK